MAEITSPILLDSTGQEIKDAILSLRDAVSGPDDWEETAEDLRREIDVERSRIDSLASLEEGSTTGDAELQDIRIGFDGTVYETAGDAVRAQGVKITVETFEDEAQPVAATMSMRSVPAVTSTTNTADTKVTLTIDTLNAANQYVLDLRHIYNLENHGGVTHVDWGDGSATDIVGKTDDEMKHQYATAGTYTVTITALTDIPLLFMGKKVSAAVIGSTVERIRTHSFAENPNLKEVTIHAPVPPVIYDGGTVYYEPFYNSPVEKIYVPNSDYLTAEHWSAYASVMVVNGDSGDSGEDSGGDDSGGGNDEVIVSGSGYKLMITTARGTETLYLYQGAPGNDGKNGKDGFSPTITVEEIEGGNRLTITDKNGTQSVDLLNGEQNEDTTATKVTMTVAGGYMLDIRSIYNLENHGGVTHVDWGDGSATDIVGKTDDEMKHIYAKGGTYTVTLVGLTHLPALIFRSRNVSAVEIGSTVEFIGYFAFNECPDLTEVTIYATTPPVLSEVTISSPYLPFDLTNVKAIRVPAESLFAYSKADVWKDYFAGILCALDETTTNVFGDKVVTVGAGGDFATINEALAYLSMYYPLYKANGIKCEIRILDGTIINEQIWVERIDLSYITITSANANNTVQVDVTGWTGITHDTRGNKPFISGEHGARLPCIACLFSCIVPTGGWVTSGDSDTVNMAVGYFCNRGSTGVVAGSVDTNDVRANVGFENFYDNIIANNNSEIVVREAIVRNAGRYGVLSRHISRISARSADITNCGDIAAYTDRASMMDVRHADLSGSKNAIAAYHASTVTANETDANNIGALVADARFGSVINCQGIVSAGSKDVFKVTGGATIVATGAAVTNETGTKYSQDTNTLTANGVIYA